MSNFKCEICGANILEGSRGHYITGCQHYPLYGQELITSRKINKFVLSLLKDPLFPHHQVLWHIVRCYRISTECQGSFDGDILYSVYIVNAYPNAEELKQRLKDMIRDCYGNINITVKCSLTEEE